MASLHSPLGAIDGVYIADPATGRPMVERNTYWAVAQMVPAATPTDVLEIVGGTNKTIEILSIRVTGTIATTNGIVFDVVKRSSANTGGTSTNATVVPSCSTDPVSGVTIKQYTANPTLGTSLGTMISTRLTILSATSTTARTEYDLIRGIPEFQPISLFGPSETLCVNLAAVATPPTLLTFTILFAEYATYRGT